MERDIGEDDIKVVDTIRQRMNRAERVAVSTAATSDQFNTQSRLESPTSISHARFAGLSSRLAQVAAKASADALVSPAYAHEPMPAETVLRLLSDLRRLADAIAAISAGDLQSTRFDEP